MKKMYSVLLPALLALSFALPACAQYVWIDNNNVKVYSDKPPPVHVPAHRILKGPRGYQPKTIKESKAEPGDATNGRNKDGKAASAPQRPMTTAEKNADFNKRRMERLEKEKKEAAEQKDRQTKAENCERARAYQRALRSGQRISRSNATGGRDYMGEEERANETRKVEETLRECH